MADARSNAPKIAAQILAMVPPSFRSRLRRWPLAGRLRLLPQNDRPLRAELDRVHAPGHANLLPVLRQHPVGDDFDRARVVLELEKLDEHERRRARDRAVDGHVLILEIPRMVDDIADL